MQRTVSIGINGTGAHSIQFGGDGACSGEYLPNKNEWDFIRYGTLGYGERIVSVEPAPGFLDPAVRPDRFTVTFDSPNYVYIDDIDVSVSRGIVPRVVATRRLDNGPPEVVEIVLDQPIPINARTRFTFNDGATVNTVSFTYLLGDVNADDDFDLFDFAGLMNCFGWPKAVSSSGTPCAAFDFDANERVEAPDFAAFYKVFSAP